VGCRQMRSSGERGALWSLSNSSAVTKR
jgi:hypothetical protein